MISLQTFEDHLDRWGGALASWPAEARGEAERLLAGSAAARALHAEMVEVEAALALPAFEPPGRFAAVATRHVQGRAVPSRRVPMLRRAGWGAAAAAALGLGLLFGSANLGVHEDSPDQVLASALGLAAGTMDVD